MESNKPFNGLPAACHQAKPGTISPEYQGPGKKELFKLVDFLQLVVNNLYSGVIVCDPDCRIVFMNKVYGELLKIDPKDSVGQKIEEFFINSRLPQVVASGQPELGQRCSLKSDTPLLVNRIPIQRNGEVIGIILQTIFRDFQQFTDLLGRLDLLEKKVRHYKKGLKNLLQAVYCFEDIISQSPLMESIKQDCRRYAGRDAPILIQGPTGSGKELFAHAIHLASPRSEGPFVCINCAALPKDLLEAELFGYESGAFTGAHSKGKVGKIQLAHNGTFFLDEIGELPFNSQSKLLRIIESKHLERLGGVNSTHVDFRLVAATNRNLRAMVARHAFRDDLYFRINTLAIQIPPLTERTEDIPLLIDNYLVKLHRSDIKFSKAALDALYAYHWPGNIRELKNILERSVSLVDGNRIELDDLPPELVADRIKTQSLTLGSDQTLAAQLALCEKKIIEQTIAVNRGNMARTARNLGISRSTLYAKSHRYDLGREPAAPGSGTVL